MDNYKEMVKNFALKIMPLVMLEKFEIPNMYFKFNNEDDYNYIINILKDYSKENVINGLENIDYSKPIVEISNLKQFLFYMQTLLEQYCKIKKFRYQEKYLWFFKYIWQRMTPDDFKNPENFLKKNILMLSNNIFNEYYEEKYVNRISLFNEYFIKSKNRLSKSFDEEPKEMIFFLTNIKHQNIYFPTVRYGIYEENNKLICEIGSIQDINKLNINVMNYELYKKIDRLKYKLNKNVPDHLIENVEPKKLISLLLFISLIKERDINIIKIPSMYVLDYEFHEKNNILLKELFDTKNGYENVFIEENKKELYNLSNVIDKQYIISANKTTNFIKLFERLIYHIPSIKIIEYPMELSSYMVLDIENINNINNKYIEEILIKKKIQK